MTSSNSTAKTQIILHSLAGGCGVVVESILNYPLDTLKTRYQLITSTSPLSSPSLLSLCKSIVKNENLLSLYRGLPLVIAMQAPRGMVKFGTNYVFQDLFYHNTNSNSTAKVHIINCISGLATGIVDGIIVTPFELIKVRMQSLEWANLYKNSAHALLNTNIKAIFYGLELTLWRNSLWHAVYFGALGQQKLSTQRFVNNKWNDFIYGFIGGGLGAILSSPFDVAKTRLQNNSSSNRPWALSYVYSIYKNEGVFALYRGFVPKVLRLSVGGGVLIFSFEFMLSFLEYVHLITVGQVN